LSILLSRNKNSRIIGSVFLYFLILLVKMLKNLYAIIKSVFFFYPEDFFSISRVYSFAVNGLELNFSGKEKSVASTSERLDDALYFMPFYDTVGADFNIKSLVSRTGT